MSEPARASRSDWRLISARPGAGNAAPVTGLSLSCGFRQGTAAKIEVTLITCTRPELRRVPLTTCTRPKLRRVPLITCTRPELRDIPLQIFPRLKLGRLPPRTCTRPKLSLEQRLDGFLYIGDSDEPRHPPCALSYFPYRVHSHLTMRAG